MIIITDIYLYIYSTYCTESIKFIKSNCDYTLDVAMEWVKRINLPLYEFMIMPGHTLRNHAIIKEPIQYASNAHKNIQSYDGPERFK